MTVTPWDDRIRNRNPKVLTIFPTGKVKGTWLKTFHDAIAEFNKLSKSLKLGVTLDSPSGVQAPEPVGTGGADIQFDLGNGKLEYKAEGETFVATDPTDPDKKRPLNFSPVALHGYTARVMVQFPPGPMLIRRAFIFVPETPMVSAMMRVGKDDFKEVRRQVGSGIRLFIAIHEFIHACGPSDAEHNQQGPDADVFTIFPSITAGSVDRPEDDKILLHLAHPKPNVFAPPITIKKKVADLIRDNWK